MVHPQCQQVLDGAAAGGSVFDTDDPAEARRRYEASNRVFLPAPPDLAGVEDISIPGAEGERRARIYRPRLAESAAPPPILVYFHGGGWIFGSLDSHDGICRHVAHGSGCLVVAPDYRLAPEHRFPAGVDDAWAALRWCADEGARIGGDETRIAVGGDSAGGNFAAVVCQQARDDGGPEIAFQWLLYPAVDMTDDTGSMREFAEGHLITREAILWTYDTYLETAGQRADPRASPALTADLSGLPPALVQTAAFDPLRDQGHAYARALQSAGVPVITNCHEGMVHGFARMGALVDEAAVALDQASAELGRVFGGRA